MPPVEWIVRIIEEWEGGEDGPPSTSEIPVDKLRALTKEAQEQGVQLPSPPATSDRPAWTAWIEDCDALVDVPMTDLWRWKLPPALEAGPAGEKYALALDGLPRGGVLELYFVSNKVGAALVS